MPEPSRDVTFVFYEGEEIDAQYNGLLHVQQQRPDLIDDADFAVLLEPTDGRRSRAAARARCAPR